MTTFSKTFIHLTLPILFLIGCKTKNKSNTLINNNKSLEIIDQKMDEQETCWNTGDLECFMQHYWKSDSLMFIGKSGLTYGWQPTLDNYIESYPDKNTMGHLTFTNEVKKFIDLETIQVIGKWQLQRDSLENLSGYYSLIWKTKNNEWVIVSDHSS